MTDTADQTAAYTAHIDTFARDNLPPPDQWPVLLLDGLGYPPRLNAGVELLDRMVEAGHGDRPCLHSPGTSWTYRQLLAEANRIASVLVNDLGVVPGNRVLLRAANNPKLVACWFAVLKAGAIAVTTMPLLRARELSPMIAKARISLALCDQRLMAELEAAQIRAPELQRIVAFIGDPADRAEAELEQLMAGAPDIFENVDTAADDVCLIAFTSGTTGEPKGTMHVHRDVLAISDCFPRHVLKPEADDVFIGSPPLAFTFGLGGLVTFPMRVGASTVLLERASPELLLKGITEFKATVCFTAPTAYRAMIDLLPKYDISSLKKCVSAGETLPQATWHAFKKATGLELIDGIGATEMLHIFISAAGPDIRPGATGRPVPGYEACVIDAEGNVLPPGSTGRLAVRGPTGCRYLADERQKIYVQHGWNVTGDTYRMDEDGYFWYQARNDDMIVSSGYNIAGPEVEDALLAHPHVQECAVIGAPDAERGTTIVKAFVVPRPGAPRDEAAIRELQNFVKGEIAPYKYPRAIEYVDALPRTETGKIQRFRLREQELARAAAAAGTPA